MVRAEFPRVVLHANAQNPGYGAAANQAIARCDAPYVLLINSDTLLEPDTLQVLNTYLEQHPRAGIVGPRLCNADHTLQASCYPFPTPLNILLEESTLGRLIRYIPGLRERYVRTSAHTEDRVVPWVLGAVLAIRREAFDAVGGFDESFFMYYEEVDLSYRLSAAGWETHFTPSTTVVHIGGASTSQRRAEMARRLFASAAHFYRRHYTSGQMHQLRVVVAAIMLARIVRETIRLFLPQAADRRQRLREDRQVWWRILGDARRYWHNNG
jgi:hypothetical protein